MNTKQIEKLRLLYKKWTAGDKENPFTIATKWRGDMVAGFVQFALNEEKEEKK